ncbi:MAG: hypothetical protein RXS19_05825 [Caldisphaera sp.]
MINQHRVIENLENQLESNLNIKSLQKINQILTDFVMILDSHILEENSVVFAYAEISIDEFEKEIVLKKIDYFEKENSELCNKDKYLKILNEL